MMMFNNPDGHAVINPCGMKVSYACVNPGYAGIGYQVRHEIWKAWRYGAWNARGIPPSGAGENAHQGGGDGSDEVGRLRGMVSRLEEGIRERDTLLREVHHRIKNNFQIISSLLILQSHELTDAQSLAQFVDAQNRVKTLALIHEKQYMARDLGSIEIMEYISSLARELIQSYRRSTDVSLQFKGDTANLEIDQAIPVGLIMNELVSNALKHAFPDGRKGRIDICLSAGASDMTIVVEDDGAGMQGDVDISTAKSLGLKLVHALASQIGGTVRLVSGPVTRFMLTFPLKQIAPTKAA